MNPIDPDPPRPQPDGFPPGTGRPAQQSVRITQVPETVRPYVSWGLLALTVLVFLLQTLSEALLGTDYLLLFGAKINEFIYQGQIWRLLSPVLLHGSLLHIGFNMYALYILGPGLERHYGHIRFFILYMLAAFAGNVMSLVFTESASLGASTAIFGLIAAQGIFIYRNRFLFGRQYGRAISNIIMIVVINFVLGLQPGIDNWGHLGGLLGGGLFAWFSGPLYRIEQNLSGYTLVNKRSGEDTRWALIMTGLLFSAVAVMKILFFR